MIPNRYENVKFEDVPENIKAFYYRIRPDRKGIYIHGGVGTGKTHILYALWKKWMEDRDNEFLKIEDKKKEYEYDHYKRDENGAVLSYFFDEAIDNTLTQELEKLGRPRLTAQVINTTDMLYEARKDYEAGAEYRESIINSSKLLMFDDIGSEKVTEWVEEFLYLAVNKRYEKNHPMLFTSNLPLSKLAEKIGDRTVSRIKEMCHIVELKGEDRRIKK